MARICYVDTNPGYRRDQIPASLWHVSAMWTQTQAIDITKSQPVYGTYLLCGLKPWLWTWPNPSQSMARICYVNTNLGYRHDQIPASLWHVSAMWTQTQAIDMTESQAVYGTYLLCGYEPRLYTWPNLRQSMARICYVDTNLRYRNDQIPASLWHVSAMWTQT